MFSYDYEVTFTYNGYNIVVSAVTDVKDDDVAISVAKNVIDEDLLEYPEPEEITVKLCGVYGGMWEED